MSAEAERVAPTLRWRKPDEYHIRTECGRFTVTRITVSPNVWYIAFRLPKSELGATRLPATASDDERMAAIREMQSLCEAAA